jgi:hypothetical protein
MKHCIFACCDVQVCDKTSWNWNDIKTLHLYRNSNKLHPGKVRKPFPKAYSRKEKWERVKKKIKSAHKVFFEPTTNKFLKSAGKCLGWEFISKKKWKKARVWFGYFAPAKHKFLKDWWEMWRKRRFKSKKTLNFSMRKKLYFAPLRETYIIEVKKNKKNTFLDILNWQPF